MSKQVKSKNTNLICVVTDTATCQGGDHLFTHSFI